MYFSFSFVNELFLCIRLLFVHTTYCFKNRSKSASRIAPLCCTASPLVGSATIVGMASIPNSAATLYMRQPLSDCTEVGKRKQHTCTSSTFSFKKTMFCSFSAAFPNTGAKALHGGHLKKNKGRIKNELFANQVNIPCRIKVDDHGVVRFFSSG